METINDVLYYLNQLDFTDKVNNDDFENFRCVKRILVREFEDYNLDKLIQVLCLVDRLMVLTTTGTLDDVLDSTHTLRENIFCLINFKHFVNKNDGLCDWNLLEEMVLYL